MPTPTFDDPMVRMCMHYTYEWLLCVKHVPRFVAREFQVPMDACSGYHGTHVRMCVVGSFSSAS